jgi:hypothetical protein
MTQTNSSSAPPADERTINMMKIIIAPTVHTLITAQLRSQAPDLGIDEKFTSDLLNFNDDIFMALMSVAHKSGRYQNLWLGKREDSKNDKSSSTTQDAAPTPVVNSSKNEEPLTYLPPSPLSTDSNPGSPRSITPRNLAAAFDATAASSGNPANEFPIDRLPFRSAGDGGLYIIHHREIEVTVKLQTQKCLNVWNNEFGIVKIGKAQQFAQRMGDYVQAQNRAYFAPKLRLPTDPNDNLLSPVKAGDVIAAIHGDKFMKTEAEVRKCFGVKLFSAKVEGNIVANMVQKKGGQTTDYKKDNGKPYVKLFDSWFSEKGNASFGCSEFLLVPKKIMKNLGQMYCNPYTDGDAMYNYIKQLPKYDKTEMPEVISLSFNGMDETLGPIDLRFV